MLDTILSKCDERYEKPECGECMDCTYKEYCPGDCEVCLSIVKDTYEIQVELLQRFVEIAKEYGLYIDTCAEIGDFHKIGVEHAHCIDRERIERMCCFYRKIMKTVLNKCKCS